VMWQSSYVGLTLRWCGGLVKGKAASCHVVRFLTRRVGDALLLANAAGVKLAISPGRSEF